MLYCWNSYKFVVHVLSLHWNTWLSYAEHNSNNCQHALLHFLGLGQEFVSNTETSQLPEK
jgi:hypothetical protein